MKDGRRLQSHMFADGQKPMNLHSSRTPVCAGSVVAQLESAHTPHRQETTAESNHTHSHTHLYFHLLEDDSQSGFRCLMCLVNNCGYFYWAKTVFTRTVYVEYINQSITQWLKSKASVTVETTGQLMIFSEGWALNFLYYNNNTVHTSDA